MSINNLLFNNSFYYIDIFLGLIGFVTILLVSVSILLKNTFNKIGYVLKITSNYIVRLLKRHEIQFCIIIVSLVVISRVNFIYGDVNKGIRAPESIFSLQFLGIDLQTGVILPTIKMLKGENFYDHVSSYGPSANLTLAPFLKGLIDSKYCVGDGSISCLHVLYPFYIFFSILIFAAILFFGPQGKFLLYRLLIISIAILGIPGSLALERGNIDTVFMGLLWLAITVGINQIHKFRIISVFIGGLIGYVSVGKMFLLVYSIPFIFISPYPLLYLITVLFVSLGLSYLPIIYGVKSDPFKLINTIQSWSQGARYTYYYPKTLAYNYSISAMTSYIYFCQVMDSCDTRNILEIILNKIAYVMLFCLVFIVSGLRFLKFIIQNIWLKRLKKIFHYIWSSRVELGILLLSMSTAAINLLPDVSYAYRLLYSVPILCLLSDRITNKSVRISLLISIFFFAFRSSWIEYGLDYRVLEWGSYRIGNVTTLLHYYFLIRTSYLLLDKRKLYEI